MLVRLHIRLERGLQDLQHVTVRDSHDPPPLEAVPVRPTAASPCFPAAERLPAIVQVAFGCRLARGCTWEKQVLSARGFKRVGKHSEYDI
jgi:hypothetical protein